MHEELPDIQITEIPFNSGDWIQCFDQVFDAYAFKFA